jgi:type IV pilus assembly protein PilB
MNSLKIDNSPTLPVAIDDVNIHQDVLGLYFNYLANQRVQFAALTEPWLPIGAVGPILVMAHDDPSAESTLPVPDWLVQKVSVSQEDYSRLHAHIAAKAQAPLTSLPAPRKRRPEARIAFGSAAEALAFMLDSLFMRPTDRAAAELIHSRAITGNALPSDAPEGFNEAAVFLLRAGTPIIDPRAVEFKSSLSEFIPTSAANATSCIGLCIDDRNVAIYISSRPRNQLMDGIASLRRCTRKEIVLVHAPAATLATCIQERQTRMSRAEFQRSESTKSSTADFSQQHIKLDESELSQLKMRDVSLTAEKLFDLILFSAIKAGASDIHFEQVKGRGRIRVRIDGRLREMHYVPMEMARNLIGVVKSGRIHGFTTNNYDPQDTSSSVRLGNQVINIRASLTPHFKNGFQVLVIRLLPKHTSLLTLSQLGIPERDMRIIRRAITRPSGLILVTGPTGSGKTTTLHACLNEINSTSVRITTAEDPVEIELDGATQSGIDEGHDIGFPDLVRASLRQDIDIMMVGEIRDRETARKTLEAACTGHLVFATLHANSETDAASRMADLLDDRTLVPVLAKSLLLVQSQRLVRKLCHSCRVEHKLTAGEKAVFEKEKIKVSTIYQPNHNGCSSCYEGYSGQTAIMSLLPVTAEIAEVIATCGTSFEVRRKADARGFMSLYQEALEKVASGETSMEEASDWEDPWANFEF